MSAPPWQKVVDRGHTALLLVRHGRTAYNHQGRFLGVTDIGLDDVGRAEAQALGATVGRRFDAVYTSRLARARQTADALAPPEPIVVEGLHELDQGDLEGLDRHEAISRFPDFFAAWSRDPGGIVVPGGECLAAARDRALAALRGAAVRHGPGEVIAAVTHQVVIASVGCTLAGDPLGSWRNHGVPNTGTALLSWDGSTLRLEDVRVPGSAGRGV